VVWSHITRASLVAGGRGGGFGESRGRGSRFAHARCASTRAGARLPQGLHATASHPAPCPGRPQSPLTSSRAAERTRHKARRRSRPGGGGSSGREQPMSLLALPPPPTHTPSKATCPRPLQQIQATSRRQMQLKPKPTKSNTGQTPVKPRSNPAPGPGPPQICGSGWRCPPAGGSGRPSSRASPYRTAPCSAGCKKKQNKCVPWARGAAFGALQPLPRRVAAAGRAPRRAAGASGSAPADPSPQAAHV
jgi:hypothetical protein